METLRYEMVVRCKDPIAHSSTTIGNAQLIMRKGVRLIGGKYVDVAYITGDAIRHQLREAAIYGTLYAAGLLDDPKLVEGAVRLLFNGGGLTGRGSASVINLDRYRELVALFPPLAIFGGNTDNRSIGGQLNVDEGNLLCKEMLHVTPPWVIEWAKDAGEEIGTRRKAVEEVQRVRMDALNNPETLKLLSEDARMRVMNRMLSAEKAHEAGDGKLAKENKSEMMPRTFERIKQGELLWLGVEARLYSALERDAFDFTLACLLNNFRVGGKRGTGHGRLEFVKGARCTFAPTMGKFEDVGSELAPKTGELYKQHIQFRRDELISWLRSEVNS